MQERLIKNKTLLTAIEPAISCTSLEVTFGMKMIMMTKMMMIMMMMMMVMVEMSGTGENSVNQAH